MDRLNRNELFVGAVVAFCFFPKFGYWTIPLIPAMSILWALGGASFDGNTMKISTKLFRRIGCSILPCLVAYALFRQWYVFLAFPMAFGVLTLGYGIPDDTDDGSFLGRLFYKYIENKGSAPADSERFANFYVRSIIYLLLGLSFLPIFLS